MDVEKVHLPHTDNLIARLNIANFILKHIMIDPTSNVSLLFSKALKEMELHLSMLTL